MQDRKLDLEDMYVMARSGLDYGVILKECELQSDINESVWESGLYTKCEELDKKYGVFVPVMRKLRRIAERKLAARAVYRMIREGASDKVAVMKRKGKLTKRDVELGLEVLVKRKRIRIDKKGKIVLTES